MKNGIICTFEDFSKLDSDIQCNSLVITSNQENETKISNLLKFLNDQGGNYLFTTRYQSDVEASEIISQIKEIEISNQVIEDLHSKRLLNSSGFENHLGNFETISIKSIYPSSSFDNIYNQIIDLKSKLSTRTAIIFKVFISGTSEIDEKFSHYSNVDIIEIDKTVTSIKNNSFNKCSSLKKLTIPSSIKSIENKALDGLTPSTQIIIPPPKDLNIPDVLYYFGLLYMEGKVIEKNYEKAFEYLNKSRKIDSPDLLYFLGVLYEKGEEVKQDLTKAKEYYEKAAKLGKLDAMYNLGLLYLGGYGVDKKCANEIK